MGATSARILGFVLVAAAAGAGIWAYRSLSAIEKAVAEGQAGAVHAKTPVLRPLPSNPTIGGRCLPNLEVAAPFPFRTNGRGYRGPEPAVPKPKETLRVVLVGGPVAFGAYASEEGETVGAQLQVLLVRNVADRKVEVLSAGPGGSEEEAVRGLLELDLGVDVEPTLLVWLVERERHDAKDRAAAERRPRALGGLGIADWGVWRAEPIAGADGAPATRPATAAFARAQERVGAALAADLAAGYEPGAANPKIPDWASEVAARCQQKGIPLVVACLPDPLEADSELRAAALDAMPLADRGRCFAKVDFARTSRTASAIAERKIAVLDLTAILREGADLRRLVLWDSRTGGWNGAAGGLVAAQIASHLIARGLAR